MIYLLLFINIIMLASGQVLWKIGVGKSSFNLSIQGIIDMFLILIY